MKVMWHSKRNWAISALLMTNFITVYKLSNPAQLSVKDAETVQDNISINTASLPTEFHEEKIPAPAPVKDIQISKYDIYFKKYAEQLGWDWRLLAALSHHESSFNAKAHSSGGMVGLMQLVPSTAYQFRMPKGKEYDPESNIKAGVSYLIALDKIWSHIEDKNERIKFILASYNSGEGNVIKACKASKAQGLNSNIWDGNVAESFKKIKGSFTCNYINTIIAQFEGYKNID